ncbi:MAG: hypothetical protein ACAH95_05050 [Fimbriimonas sp.]
MPISRRELLKAAAVSPLLAKSAFAASSPKQRPVIGTGEHTYEVYHDWLTPPANIAYGDTHGLALDSQGRIYVAHTVGQGSVKTDAVLVFDQQGKFINSWGSDFKGGAHGLDLRKEGSEEFLYHCDTRRRLVAKSTLDGKMLWEKGVPMESGVYKDAGGWCPTNVAFGPDGSVFVGDGYGSHYIHRYSKNGDYLGVIVKPGSQAGTVREPHGLWVDSRDGWSRLVVADRGNRRLQYLTLDGQHIGFVKEGIRRPCHIHFNHDLMLIPDLESVVTILGKDNQVVAQLGDGNPSNLRGAPREQYIPGKFIHPHAAIWINSRDIVVAEWVPTGRITLLKRVS